MTRQLFCILTLTLSLTVYGQTSFKEKGNYDKMGNCVGIWNFYSEDGTLVKSIDYNTAIKTYYTSYRDPYDDIFEKMKLKGDSFLLNYFEKDFISKHIKWEPNESYYYSRPGGGGHWFEIAQGRPNKFLFRYNLVLDQKHIYHFLIRFEMNETGTINHVIDQDLTGIEDCKHRTFSCEFNTSYKQALDTAESHGLKSNKKTIFYMDWRRINPKDSLGEYEIIVANFKTKERKGNNTTFYYDAIIINPWTGKYKERVELKSNLIVDTNASISSGLRR